MLSLPNRVLSTRPSRRANHRPTQRRALALAAAALLCAAGPSQAATNLADQPLFAASDAPGNLALLLSVEFPTAVSVAHTNRSYSAGSEYLGFFDPKKCYSYRYSDGTGTDNYFYPVGTATGHRCTSRWSGNFLNWSSMQTIDPFRWVLTGGYRVVDTASLMVVEKAWAIGQGMLHAYLKGWQPQIPFLVCNPFGLLLTIYFIGLLLFHLSVRMGRFVLRRG